MTTTLGHTQVEQLVAPAQLSSEDWNFVLSLRQQAEWSAGGETAIAAHTLMTTTGAQLPIAPYNAAVRLSRASAPHVLDATMDWFASRNRGFSLYVRSCADSDLEEECRKRKLTLCAILPVMTIDKVTGNDHDAGVTLTRVGTPGEARQFSEVAAEAFCSDCQPTRAVVDAFANASRMFESKAPLFLAKVEGQVIGCCQLLIADGTAGLYWNSVRERFRNRGYASQMTRSVVRYALAAGAQRVVLQATPAATSLYRRLGFVETSQLKCYCWPLRSRPKAHDPRRNSPGGLSAPGQNSACAIRAQLEGS